MTRFRQLTIEERYQIQIYNAQGFSQRAIARTLNRAASTISRELARNVDLISGEYRSELAQVHTDMRRREADKFRITDERIIKIVEWALTEHQWSPQQTAFFKLVVVFFIPFSLDSTHQLNKG